MTDADGSLRWNVIVPLKDLTLAKSRLQRSPDDRAKLMIAFASDVIDACLNSPLVDQVTVVGSDYWRSRPLGHVDFIPDPGHGLNAAVRAALRTCPDGSLVAVMVADLPCARESAVTALLRAAHETVTSGGLAAVPDLSGQGTTVLLGGTDLEPQFGAGSFTRHRETGAVALVSESWSCLRLDVDDDHDLALAAEGVLGSATRSALAQG